MWVRASGLVLLTLALFACEEKRPPAQEAPPTPKSAPADAPVPYQVLKDELNNGTNELHVLVAPTIRHDETQKLLEFLYRHVMTRHEDPPSGMAGYVYTSEAAFRTPPPTPIGTVLKRASDLGPRFENKLPLEFSQEIDQALARRADTSKGWKHALQVSRNDEARSVSLTVPYTELGKDEWAQTLSFNQALQTFCDLAMALFDNVHDLRAMTFSGVWKDREVVRIALTRAEYQALKLNELEERIGAHHGSVFLEVGAGKSSQLSPEEANRAASRQAAAVIAKEYRGLLAQLKGRATVSPTLR
ncbi:MAG TPA: hypothetical protein VH877_08425 [Polyangia bacterium]|nr:hypothetical protein [Polyangia bacterium]